MQINRSCANRDQICWRVRQSPLPSAVTRSPTANSLSEGQVRSSGHANQVTSFVFQCFEMSLCLSQSLCPFFRPRLTTRPPVCTSCSLGVAAQVGLPSVIAVTCLQRQQLSCTCTRLRVCSSPGADKQSPVRNAAQAIRRCFSTVQCHLGSHHVPDQYATLKRVQGRDSLARLAYPPMVRTTCDKQHQTRVAQRGVEAR